MSSWQQHHVTAIKDLFNFGRIINKTDKTLGYFHNLVKVIAASTYGFCDILSQNSYLSIAQTNPFMIYGLIAMSYYKLNIA